MELRLTDYEAVLFDLDGTLVDSMGMWGQIDVEFLARFGIACPPDLQEELEGLGWTENALYFIRRFGIDLSPSEIGVIWLRMAEEKYRCEVPAKDGAADFVRDLRRRGMKLAVASSNHRGLIVSALQAHGLENQFDLILTCEDVQAGKPDPAVYLQSAARLQADPARCLVFEDIPKGILSAKRAGMTCIAVKDRYSAHLEEEKREMADGLIASYREIRWI